MSKFERFTVITSSSLSVVASAGSLLGRMHCLVNSATLQLGRTTRRLAGPVLIALLLGLVFSLLAALAAGLLAGTVQIGLIIGLAMAGAVLIASINAVLIPLICARFGIDPAVVSGPFVTVLNDILGGAAYVLVGVLVLGG